VTLQLLLAMFVVSVQHDLVLVHRQEVVVLHTRISDVDLAEDDGRLLIVRRRHVEIHQVDSKGAVAAFETLVDHHVAQAVTPSHRILGL